MSRELGYTFHNGACSGLNPLNKETSLARFETFEVKDCNGREHSVALIGGDDSKLILAYCGIQKIFSIFPHPLNLNTKLTF